MRTPQEIFRLIVNGYKYYHSSYRYMCISLDCAARDGFISYDEHEMCINAINEFIGKDNTTLTELISKSVRALTGVEWLDGATDSEKYEHCRNIYLNWDNRHDYIIPLQYRK